MFFGTMGVGLRTCGANPTSATNLRAHFGVGYSVEYLINAFFGG